MSNIYRKTKPWTQRNKRRIEEKIEDFIIDVNIISKSALAVSI